MVVARVTAPPVTCDATVMITAGSVSSAIDFMMSAVMPRNTWPKRDAQQGLGRRTQRAVRGKLLQNEYRFQQNHQRHEHRAQNMRQQSEGLLPESRAEQDLQQHQGRRQDRQRPHGRPAVVEDVFRAAVPGAGK